MKTKLRTERQPEPLPERTGPARYGYRSLAPTVDVKQGPTAADAASERVPSQAKQHYLSSLAHHFAGLEKARYAMTLISNTTPAVESVFDHLADHVEKIDAQLADLSLRREPGGQELTDISQLMRVLLRNRKRLESAFHPALIDIKGQLEAWQQSFLYSAPAELPESARKEATRYASRQAGYLQPSRAEKCPLTTFIDPQLAQAFKKIAEIRGIHAQTLFEEAIRQAIQRPPQEHPSVRAKRGRRAKAQVDSNNPAINKKAVTCHLDADLVATFKLAAKRAGQSTQGFLREAIRHLVEGFANEGLRGEILEKDRKIRLGAFDRFLKP